MKVKSIILLLFCFLLSGASVYAKPQSTVSELNQLADDALQFTRYGRYEEAKILLESFEVLFSNEGVSERPFTMDELRALKAAHHEALRAVTSTSLNEEDKVNQVTAFRFATDAITSQYQPLWTEMEKPIMEAYQQVKNAALEGDSGLYNRQINAFLATYSVIQPSLKIDIPVALVQKLDSRISYIDHYRIQFSEEGWMEELDSLEVDLNKLFSEINDDEMDPSIWWVIAMTGSIIITTLSYVSWRKYGGQKTQKKRKDSND